MGPGAVPPNMPTPAPTPAPTPTAATPTPAAAPVPTFSGSVVIAVFGDVSGTISTGDKAQAKSSGPVVEWDKVEATLKRVEGVTGATLDTTSRRINVSYAGAFASVDKVRNSIQTSGVSCELISPAKVTFRPMGTVDEDGKLLAALRGIAGVQMVTKDYNDFTLYADLSAVDLDTILQAAQGAGVKGAIASHELFKVALTSTTGNSANLLDELSKTKWILKAEIEASTNSVKVLAVKGRVTRALVKTIMTKCGFPEGK